MLETDVNGERIKRQVYERKGRGIPGRHGKYVLDEDGKSVDAPREKVSGPYECFYVQRHKDRRHDDAQKCLKILAPIEFHNSSYTPDVLSEYTGRQTFTYY